MLAARPTWARTAPPLRSRTHARPRRAAAPPSPRGLRGMPGTPALPAAGAGTGPGQRAAPKATDETSPLRRAGRRPPARPLYAAGTLAGSLSPASSDSQATRCRPRRTHSASRTVLPYPAGAQTRTSPRPRPSSSRCASRGRGTRSGRNPGTFSLVASRTSRSDVAASAAGSPIGNLHDRRLQRSCVAARTSHRSCRPPGLNPAPDRGGTIVPAPSRKIPPAWATFG